MLPLVTFGAFRSSNRLGSHASPRGSTAQLARFPREQLDQGRGAFVDTSCRTNPTSSSKVAPDLDSECSGLTPIWSIDFMPLPLFHTSAVSTRQYFEPATNAQLLVTV
jgi:hypothetical protein